MCLSGMAVGSPAWLAPVTASPPALQLASPNQNSGVSIPTPLEVSGTVKVAGNGAEACTLATVGMIRINPVTGVIQACRP